jgi:NAD(P)-dependent dehydrogenase (short-subunit alcohol dehydrogenase family)
MTTLADRLVVVTGASRGIGAATAAAAFRQGARVIRVSRSQVDKPGDGFIDLRADLADADAVATLAERVLAEFGAPDLVVSNAGSFSMAPLHQTLPAEFDKLLAVNLRAPWLVARAFLPAMRQRGHGDLIQVGSVADHTAFPDNSAYAATKYGLRGLHESLLKEYRGSGVRLSLVSPGPTDTAIWDAVDPDGRPGFISRGRMLRPEDVAEAILWVATRPDGVGIDWVVMGPVPREQQQRKK